MYILIILQLMNSIFLVREPDELFSEDDREPYVVTADRVVLDETDQGRVSHLIGDVEVVHGKTVITGDEGYVYEKQKMAEITGGIRIDDEGTVINSGTGRYFRETKMAVLIDSVVLQDGQQVLMTDSLVYYKTKKLAFATGNVVLIDKEQNSEVKGSYGEYDFIKESGFITDAPSLTLWEEEKEITITGDTLKIERKKNFMSCVGNVEVCEDSIISHSGYLEYYSDSEKIYLEENPVVEQKNKSTLSGNSIQVFLDKREIVKTVALGFAKGNYHFTDGGSNDVMGDSITIFFNDGRTYKILVTGNANGVYRKVKEEATEEGVNEEKEKEEEDE
jgi:lipopolysaccharide export system protein LptA